MRESSIWISKLFSFGVPADTKTGIKANIITLKKQWNSHKNSHCFFVPIMIPSILNKENFERRIKNCIKLRRERGT